MGCHALLLDYMFMYRQVPTMRRRSQGRGFYVPHMPNARIAWYKKQNRFYAYCGHREKHGAQCRVTATSYAPLEHHLSMGNPASGRPCGHLFAWILFDSDLASAEAHSIFCPSLNQRIVGRALLRQYESGRKVLARELPMDPDEDSEHEIPPR